MKTVITFTAALVLSVSASQIQAQWIQSLTVSPANPTTTDNIVIYADLSFPSAGCSDHTQTMSVNGNSIYASALHCLGILTMICDYTDTFMVGQLPAGNYTFYFQLDAGALPSPCTPGFVPGPNDSVSFTVSPAVGTGEIIPGDAVGIYPNPGNSTLQLSGLDPSDFPADVRMYSHEGKLIQTFTIQSPEESFNIHDLPPAVYQVHIQTARRQPHIIPYSIVR